MYQVFKQKFHWRDLWVFSAENHWRDFLSYFWSENLMVFQVFLINNLRISSTNYFTHIKYVLLFLVFIFEVCENSSDNCKSFCICPFRAPWIRRLLQGVPLVKKQFPQKILNEYDSFFSIILLNIFAKFLLILLLLGVKKIWWIYFFFQGIFHDFH